jgi:predicted transcriptional regulator
MSFFIQQKPSGFLVSLARSKGKVLKTGRDFYSCNNSIYEALERFSKWGLIEVEKGKRDLDVKITPLGKEVIAAISLLKIY